MAIGWLTVLQSIPWSDVISNAPKVATGAKKLWNTVSRQPGSTRSHAADQCGSSAAQVDASPVAARLQALEADIADLQQQMLESAELIKALADQNAQLIVRIDAGRRRLLWLSAGALVAVLVSITALLMALTRSYA